MKQPKTINTENKKPSFLAMFNELQINESDKELNQTDLSFLLKAKSFEELENHSFDTRIFIKALSVFFKHEENDLEKRQTAALKLMTMFNFQDQDQKLTDNQNELLDIFESDIQPAINLLMQKPDFVIGQKSNLVKTYQNTNTEYNFFQKSLKQSLTENVNEHSLRALIIEKTLIDTEIKYGKKKLLNTTDKVERALINSELKKEKTEQEVSFLMTEIYKSYFENMNTLKDVEANAKKHADKLFQKNKGVIQNAELLSLIQTRKEKVEPDAAIKYVYAIKHKKRIDYLQEQTIKPSSNRNLFGLSRDNGLFNEDKNELYSKISNGFAVSPSPHRKVVIQDIIDKLLVDDPMSKVFINFGSKVEPEQRFNDAFTALEEMKNFLKEANVFKNDDLLKEHIIKNFNVAGVDMNALIAKAFPNVSLEMNITAEKTNSVSLVEHLNIVLIEYARLDNDEAKNNFIKNEIAELKTMLQGSKNFNADQVSTILKTLDTPINPENFEDTLNTLKQNHNKVELQVIREIRQSNKAVPVIPNAVSKPLVKPEPETEAVKVVEQVIETPAPVVKEAVKTSNDEAMDKFVKDYVDGLKVGFSPAAVEAIDIITDSLKEVSPEFQGEIRSQFEKMLNKENVVLNLIEDKEYILFDEEANKKFKQAFDDLVMEHQLMIADFKPELETKPEIKTDNTNNVVPIKRKEFNADEELEKILKTLSLVVASTDHKVVSEEMEQLIQDRIKVNRNINSRIADIRKLTAEFPELTDLQKLAFDSKENGKSKLDLANYNFADNERAISVANGLIRNHNVRFEIDTQLPELLEKRKPKTSKGKKP